jgi:hypothetical protein
MMDLEELRDLNACDDRCRGRCLKCPNDTIREAVEEIKQLRALLAECADDLNVWVETHYENSLQYPGERRRRDRDMEPVRRARALLPAEKT